MNRLDYTGSKGGQTVAPFLINYIPISHRYFSLFYGKGSLENSKLLHGTKWICSEINPDLHTFSSTTAVVEYFDYRSLVVNNIFTVQDFIFVDPPYLLKCRTNSRKYYKFEFDVQDHVELLRIISKLQCRILITHPKCELYSSMLPGWHCIEFSYMTRAGWFQDALYMNYDISTLPLVNYSCLGVDHTDRQRIKRKRANFIRKFQALPYHERMAIIYKLNYNR